MAKLLYVVKNLYAAPKIQFGALRGSVELEDRQEKEFPDEVIVNLYEENQGFRQSIDDKSIIVTPGIIELIDKEAERIKALSQNVGTHTVEPQASKTITPALIAQPPLKPEKLEEEEDLEEEEEE